MVRRPAQPDNTDRVSSSVISELFGNRIAFSLGGISRSLQSSLFGNDLHVFICAGFGVRSNDLLPPDGALVMHGPHTPAEDRQRRDNPQVGLVRQDELTY